MAEDPAFFGLVLAELGHGVDRHGGRRLVDGGGGMRRVLPVTVLYMMDVALGTGARPLPAASLFFRYARHAFVSGL